MAGLIRVRVELHLTLAERFPGGMVELDTREGTTVEDILRQVGLPDAEVGLVVRNGLSLEADDVLHDGDALMIFPPLSGG